MLSRTLLPLLIAASLGGQLAVAQPTATTHEVAFPRELVDWKPLAENPVFEGAGLGHWDAVIRERGWILREGDEYHLWYTGYDGRRERIKQLGYATSRDGLKWTRSPSNPLCPGQWIEDAMVVRNGSTYYMFAEGPQPSESQLLTSPDGVKWTVVGVLDIRTTNGRRIERPFGTPIVWLEDGSWYLFYERADLGVWLATTHDPRSLRWTNVSDQPVMEPGPAEYDLEMIAVDQIIKHRGVYYAFYYASGRCAEGGTRTWSTNIARSTDLRH
jgi:ribosomal protein L24E